MKTQDRSKLLKLIGKHESLITLLNESYFIYAIDNRPLVIVKHDEILFANEDSRYFDSAKYRNCTRRFNLMLRFVVEASDTLIRNVYPVDQVVIDSYLPVNQE